MYDVRNIAIMIELEQVLREAELQRAARKSQLIEEAGSSAYGWKTRLATRLVIFGLRLDPGVADVVLQRLTAAR